jgi:aminoglycoside 6'-N-acetyltransferase I
MVSRKSRSSCNCLGAALAARPARRVVEAEESYISGVTPLPDDRALAAGPIAGRCGVSIRTAASLDLEPSVALACQAARERGAEIWRDALSGDIEQRQRLLLVADIAGKVVGYGRARLFRHPPDPPADTAPEGYYLTGVFVHPDWRRSGIGAALVEARLLWIAERAHEAWFFANARNIASIELHRRFGFEEITRHFSFLRLTFDGGEGILFRSRLGALPRVGVRSRGLQGRLRARVLVLIAQASQPD